MESYIFSFLSISPFRSLPFEGQELFRLPSIITRVYPGPFIPLYEIEVRPACNYKVYISYMNYRNRRVRTWFELYRLREQSILRFSLPGAKTGTSIRVQLHPYL